MRTARRVGLGLLVLAGVLWGGSGVVAAPAQAAATVTVTLDTAQGRFAAEPNQGWWGLREVNGSSGANYYAGRVVIVHSRQAPPAPESLRNFFTFDLRSVRGRVVSATLLVDRPDPGRDGLPATYELHDVTTAPRVLNTNRDVTDPRIYADLGTGTRYGSYQLGPGSPALLRLPLSSAGVRAADNSRGKYFSLGGVVVGPGHLFWNSGAEAQQLRLVLQR